MASLALIELLAPHLLALAHGLRQFLLAGQAIAVGIDPIEVLRHTWAELANFVTTQLAVSIRVHAIETGTRTFADCLGARLKPAMATGPTRLCIDVMTQTPPIRLALTGWCSLDG